MKKLIISSFFIFILSASGCAQIKRAKDSVDGSSIDQKQARDLSDSVTKDLIEDRYKDLYLKTEKAFRDATPENDMKPILEQIYSVYGKPLEAEYKKDEVGFKIYDDGSRKPMRKFWYAIRTSKAEKGRYFLFTEIVPDGDSLASSFSIVSFSEGIPPSLQ